jgi:hypothetical protein
MAKMAVDEKEDSKMKRVIVFMFMTSIVVSAASLFVEQANPRGAGMCLPPAKLCMVGRPICVCDSMGLECHWECLK